MKSFSERKGIKPVKNVIQVDSMDDDLRNGLWSALFVHYFDLVRPTALGYRLSNHPNLERLVYRLWAHHFKKPVDTINFDWLVVRRQIRDYYFGCSWNDVYDFVEFVANNYPDKTANQDFMGSCNTVLEKEVSAYRFAGAKITPITSDEEVAEIEEALGVPQSLKPVASHLKRALDLLADRESPDYRNSVKESISAVEAICKLITTDAKAELKQALREIEKKTGLHSALKNAFSSLYGYTSDAQGIRHALMDEPSLDLEDAKFMLVSCSAFVNYLVTKSSKAGIKL